MGGNGSGSYYRYNSKSKVEEINRLDIRYLKRQNILFNGYCGEISWSVNGRKSGAINIRIYEESIVLSYNHKKSYETEWQPVRQIIEFDTTDCNYGGHRKWFICPECGCRTSVLYTAQKLFLCRKCSDLTYSSQCESECGRHASKARKIRRQLGASENLFDSFIPKPKGMHWKTYYKLRLLEDYENNQSMALLLGKLM